MKILIVDDEPAIREMLARLLGSRGAEVTISHGVLDALDQLKLTCFDLIITDYNMPDGTAEAVITESLARCPQAKIAVMSGSIRTVSSVVIHRAHGVFEKPDIIAAIDQLLALGMHALQTKSA